MQVERQNKIDSCFIHFVLKSFVSPFQPYFPHCLLHCSFLPLFSLFISLSLSRLLDLLGSS